MVVIGGSCVRCLWTERNGKHMIRCDIYTSAVETSVHCAGGVGVSFVEIVNECLKEASLS
jgi:hypothetical protein